ncbi:MAG: putative ABC transport system ATP-binding protein [Halobacteriales archaeon]|jgi:putative ABC transport system ATP-binding protein
MPATLEIRGLVYVVDSNRIVDDLSLSIDAGDTVAIVGPSGAGKSTLLRLLDRLAEPTEGTVLLDGTDYRELPPQELRRRVGLVPQSPALREGTVAENVTVGPRLRGESVPRSRVEELLDRLELSGYADRDAKTLSGGEAQRVAIARTLVNDPDVLLLDEPTANLDDDTRSQVEDLLIDVIEDVEMTTVFVSHQRAQARRLGERIVEFEEGRVVHSSRVDDAGSIEATETGGDRA